MIRNYIYELRKSGTVVGRISLLHPLFGTCAVFPMVSVFKASYARRIETVTVPIQHVLISDDHVDAHHRTVLNVTKKSKRQIKAILDGYGVK